MSTTRDSAAAGDRPALVARTGREVLRLGDAAGRFVERVADATGLAPTDVQSLVYLASEGAAPSGKLAEIARLSPGATTRMIDRLEQAGYVRRSPDAADRRVVVVDLVPGRIDEITAHFDALDQAIDGATVDVPDERLGDLAAVLGRIVDGVQVETARLQEHPAPGPAAGSAFSAPLGGVTAARLVFVSAVPTMAIDGDPALPDLYRASFEGPVPRVRVRAGIVTVRYARFAWFDWRARIGDQMIDTSVHWRSDRGRISLNVGVPWAIELRGGGSRVRADLGARGSPELRARGRSQPGRAEPGATAWPRAGAPRGRVERPHDPAAAGRGRQARGCRGRRVGSRWMARSSHPRAGSWCSNCPVRRGPPIGTRSRSGARPTRCRSAPALASGQAACIPERRGRNSSLALHSARAMDDLYRDYILEHYRSPHNFGVLDEPSVSLEGSNPLCGDRITLQLGVHDGVVDQVAFTGRGCAISQASTSLLTDEIKGKQLADVEAFMASDLLDLLGIEVSPARLKCAMLSHETLQKALAEVGAGRATSSPAAAEEATG